MNNQTFNIWIGLRGSEHQMFASFTSIDYVISIDHDDTKTMPFISKEFFTKERIPPPPDNEELLTLMDFPHVQDFIRELKYRNETVNIYCYHSVPILEYLAATNDHIC